MQHLDVAASRPVKEANQLILAGVVATVDDEDGSVAKSLRRRGAVSAVRGVRPKLKFVDRSVDQRARSLNLTREVASVLFLLARSARPDSDVIVDVTEALQRPRIGAQRGSHESVDLGPPCVMQGALTLDFL